MRSPYFQVIGRCLFAGHFRQLAMKNQDSAFHWRGVLISLSPNLPCFSPPLPSRPPPQQQTTDPHGVGGLSVVARA